MGVLRVRTFRVLLEKVLITLSEVLVSLNVPVLLCSNLVQNFGAKRPVYYSLGTFATIGMVKKQIRTM